MTAAASLEATELWRHIALPNEIGVPDPATVEAAAQRLGELVTPSLAQHLLVGLESAIGRPVLDPAVVRASRLATRFARRQQLAWAGFVAATGIEVVYLKGFAAAHSLYSDPDVRTIGDVDVLVRQGDVERLVDLLARRGFRFSAAPRRLWGSIEDASFAPFVSPDGLCNIDIHRHPDSFPAHRSLSTESVFESSVEVMADDLPIRIPCREHMFLLSATNSARDKFGPFSARQAVDALVLLRSAPGLDWRLIETIARRGGFLAPLKVFAALLVVLGLAPDRIPRHLSAAPTGLRGREFAALAGHWRRLFPENQTLWATLRRELLLCAEPATGFRRNLARVIGLVRPRDSVPGHVAFV